MMPALMWAMELGSFLRVVSVPYAKQAQCPGWPM